MLTKVVGGLVVAWRNEQHTAVEKEVVCFKDGEITYVGADNGLPADETIDAAGCIVAPGFINAHTHVTDAAYTKGLLEEQGSKDFSTLYRVLPTVRHAVDGDAEAASAECAFAELLLAGSTTVVELGFDYEMMDGHDMAVTERVADISGQLGVRCYMAPRYRSGFYGLDESDDVFYRNYERNGRGRFENSIAFCRSFEGRFDGRIRTMLAPGQVDTCDRDLLLETRQVANELKVPVQIHAGQSPTEYRRIKETQGMTTLEYLSDVGLLGPDFLIGHGMWLAEDGNVDHLPSDELEMLVSSKTTIAHLPWVKARQSSVINSFEKYRRAGVRVALGTDTYPFDMFNEMRFCSVVCKIVEANPTAAPVAEVYHAATVAGAEALGRDDLGRIAKGCRADLLLIDIDTPHAQPLRDPFKFLVLGANAADVRRVIVDGRTVVNEGEILTTDLSAALFRLREADRRVAARIDL